MRNKNCKYFLKISTFHAKQSFDQITDLSWRLSYLTILGLLKKGGKKKIIFFGEKCKFSKLLQ